MGTPRGWPKAIGVDHHRGSPVPEVREELAEHTSTIHHRNYSWRVRHKIVDSAHRWVPIACISRPSVREVRLGANLGIGAGNPSTPNNMHQEFKSCIEACDKCAQECDHCATACLHEDDVKMMARCIELDRYCADICRMASKFMAMADEHTERYARELCRLCADICEDCGRECRKHKADHCQRCADACEACARECRQMAGVAHSRN